MPAPRSGFELPLLMAGGFRAIIDELHVHLAAHGHAESKPAHAFALQALGGEGVTIAELGRRLAVTKQAAAKTVATLERLGYAARRRSASDGRAVLVARTERGEQFLALSASFLEQKRHEWVRLLGQKRFDDLMDSLELLAGEARLSDMPSWLGSL